jgi:hypothetical protein
VSSVRKQGYSPYFAAVSRRGRLASRPVSRDAAVEL